MYEQSSRSSILRVKFKKFRSLIFLSYSEMYIQSSLQLHNTYRSYLIKKLIFPSAV